MTCGFYPRVLQHACSLRTTEICQFFSDDREGGRIAIAKLTGYLILKGARRSDRDILTGETKISHIETTNALKEIDLQILELLVKRTELLKGLGDSVPPVWELQQTAVSILEQYGDAKPLQNQLAEPLLRHMASACAHSVQPRKRVAYLGPIYSYSYLAAIRYFGESSETVPVATISAVFDEVRRGNAAWGIVPIENSTDGRIVDTLTMFAKYPIRICGEVLFPVHHCLLGRCNRSEVREVYSKPQAISQCRSWLAQSLPDAKLIEIGSTAAAARMAAEKPGAAAIASFEAGIHHGLQSYRFEHRRQPQ